MLPQYLLGLFAALLPAVLPPAPSRPPLPWNATGHRLVALVAWSQMSPHAREGAVALLRKHPRFAEDFEGNMPQAVRDDEELQPQWIFMHAATWPDIARGFKGADSKKYHHATWHYINWPIFIDEQSEQAIGKAPVNYSLTWKAGMDESNLNCVQALAMVRAKLNQVGGGVPDADRAVLLCWLEHLVGDIHQPLHASALFSMGRFPKGDKGGNSIPILGHDNLHAYWDEALGKTGSSVKSLATKASGWLAEPDLLAAGQKAKKSLSARAWRKESTGLAAEDAYSDAIVQAVAEADADGSLDDITLTAAYTAKATEVAMQRAVEAGFRLAAICGQFFGDE